MDDETGREDDFERQKKPWQWTWKTTVIRSVMPIFLCGVFVFIMPKFGEMFAELGIQLPAATIVLLKFGLFLRRFAFLVPVFIVVAIVMDYGGYVLVKQHLGDDAAHLWMGFVVVCYVTYVGFCVIVLFLPLIEDLNIVTPAPTPAPKPASPPASSAYCTEALFPLFTSSFTIQHSVFDIHHLPSSFFPTCSGPRFMKR